MNYQGTTGPDSIRGTSGDDTIQGLDGADTVVGDAGNDLVLANQGDDLVLGNQGADTVYGGQGRDTLYGGQGNDVLAGNEGDDIILGNEGDDVVLGNECNDSILGNQGDDTVYGGKGDDVVYGGKGDDVVAGNEGNDLILGNEGRDVLLGNEGDDSILGNQGNDTIYGGKGDDLIYGGKDDDLLFGGEGNDTLAGDEGDNTISGGDGVDTVLFDKASEQYAATREQDGSVDVRDVATGAVTHVDTDVESYAFTDRTTSDPVPATSSGGGGGTTTGGGTTGGDGGMTGGGGDGDGNLPPSPGPDAFTSKADTTIAFTARDPGTTNYQVGSGVPGTHVAAVDNVTQGLELSLGATPRQASDVVQYGLTARDDGTFDLNLPEGFQKSVADGGSSQSTVPNRSAYSLNFGFDADTSDTGRTLDDYDAKVVITGQGGTGTYEMQHVAPGNTPFLRDGTNAKDGFGDDDQGEGPRGAQHQNYAQSTNAGFDNVHQLIYGTPTGGGYDAAFGPADFDVTLQFLAKGSDTVVDQLTVHAHVNGMSTNAAAPPATTPVTTPTTPTTGGGTDPTGIPDIPLFPWMPGTPGFPGIPGGLQPINLSDPVSVIP